MKQSILYVLMIMACPFLMIGQLIQPEDLEYRGAFRLPEASGGSDWGYSGTAMTYYPDGDITGPDDGFPGSIFAVGHDQQMMLSEISIPVPIISAGKNPEELNTAYTIQPFTNIRNSNYAFVDFDNLPVLGLEYLPAQGGQSTGKLYFCWGLHIQFLDHSHGWCELNLSNPQTAGPWHFGNYNNYTTSDYLFEIPAAWANVYTHGQILASGRFREGVWSGFGPALYACAPWLDGNPPAIGQTLNHITPLLLYGVDDPYVAEIVTSEDMKMKWYNMVDDWSGGAWLTSGNRSAVIFAGTKGIGNDWYGFSDGTIWPYEGPYPPVPPAPHNQRGYWAESIEGRIIFYDPSDLARVAQGVFQPYEPQPYEQLDIDPILYDPGYDYVQGKRHLLGACCFDRQRGYLYVMERMADEDKSLVHVWHIQDEGTSVSAEYLPSEFILLQNHPNPFNQSTSISYRLSADSRVEIRLINMSGREVMSIKEGQKSAGNHRIMLNADHLQSGIYICQLITDRKALHIKITLIR